MNIDNKLRAIIESYASDLRNELLDRYVALQEDFTDVEPTDQKLAKICALVAACNSIVHAAEELNKRLTPVEEKKEPEEKKEWN